MKINIKANGKKTAVMLVYDDGIKKRAAINAGVEGKVDKMVNKLGIPRVNEYKYLGSNLNEMMDASNFIKTVKARAAMVKGSMNYLLTRNNLCFNIRSFQTYILPLLLMIPGFARKKTAIKNF